MGDHSRVRLRTEVRNGIAYIPLTQGQIASVDEADLSTVLPFNWYAVKTCNVFHAAAKTDSYKVVYMHRLLLNLQEGELCDHVDMNGLNNTRANLRLCSRAQNKMNQGVYKNNSSGFKGVSVVKNRNGVKYRAVVRFNGRLIHLGYFDTPEVAHAAYCKAAKELFMDFFRAS